MRLPHKNYTGRLLHETYIGVATASYNSRDKNFTLPEKFRQALVFENEFRTFSGVYSHEGADFHYIALFNIFLSRLPIGPLTENARFNPKSKKIILTKSLEEFLNPKDQVTILGMDSFLEIWLPEEYQAQRKPSRSIKEKQERWRRYETSPD